MKARDRAINDMLLRAAQRLPFNYTEANTSIIKTGEQILSENPDAKDKDGNDLELEKKYVIPAVQRMPVNHYKRMQRIYRRLGWQGVDSYCLGVLQLEYEAQQVTHIGGVQLQQH